MKVERRDGSDNVRVLAAMIRHSSVLGRISSRWEGRGLFASDAANVLGTIAVEHYRKHGKAPKSGMVPLAEAWSEGRKDGEAVELVGRLLSECLDVDKLPPEHALDLAGKLFDRIALEKLSTGISQHVDAGQLDKAFALVAEKGRRVELGTGSGVNVLEDEEAVKGWFDAEKRESLVEYPGDAGKFFRDTLCRGAFVAFLAREKGTKSTWLLDVAYRAVRQRRNVAFFDAGDSTEEEVGIRFEERICRWPSYSPNDDGKWPAEIKVPKKLKIDKGEDIAEVTEWHRREYPGPLTAEIAIAGNRKLKEKLASDRKFWKLSCHPNLSLGVSNIKSIILGWALEDWHPDVVIVDYMDLLAPPPGRMETRDQINRNWQLVRALSQEFHCLVVTGTQAKATSYEARTLGMKHFSEDKRKLAHCTAKYAINRTAAEEEAEQGRLSQVVVRKGKLRTERQLHYASCLALADPCCCSCFAEDKKKETDDG